METQLPFDLKVTFTFRKLNMEWMKLKLPSNYGIEFQGWRWDYEENSMKTGKWTSAVARFTSKQDLVYSIEYVKL